MTAGGRNVAGEQAALVAALRNPACYPHPAEQVEVIETHISYVLLSGAYAYKIKKAVALGFLDFSTLARRRIYCEEELRLNRRLAPELYLTVVAITGSPDAPRFAGNGEALHAAYWHNDFGHTKSRGCINMRPADAKWLFRWTLPVVAYEPGDITVDWDHRGTMIDVRLEA